MSVKKIFVARFSEIPQDGYPRHPGDKLPEQLKSLPAQLTRQRDDTGDIATRAGQARNESQPYDITAGCHDNRNGIRHLLDRRDGLAASGHDDVDLGIHELPSETAQRADLPIALSRLEHDVLAFDVSQLP
jgi:hypothetical protein